MVERFFTGDLRKDERALELLLEEILAESHMGWTVQTVFQHTYAEARRYGGIPWQANLATPDNQVRIITIVHEPGISRGKLKERIQMSIEKEKFKKLTEDALSEVDFGKFAVNRKLISVQHVAGNTVTFQITAGEVARSFHPKIECPANVTKQWITTEIERRLPKWKEEWDRIEKSS